MFTLNRTIRDYYNKLDIVFALLCCLPDCSCKQKESQNGAITFLSF